MNSVREAIADDEAAKTVNKLNSLSGRERDFFVALFFVHWVPRKNRVD